VRADVGSARRDWEDAYRRLEETARDDARAEGLRLELEVVTSELRKRVGSTFTLEELATEYLHADQWTLDAVAERASTAGRLLTASIVEGAAFHLYSRGAVDYSP
jgi:hypothetical protein